jgi:hypothetical protein
MDRICVGIEPLVPFAHPFQVYHPMGHFYSVKEGTFLFSYHSADRVVMQFKCITVVETGPVDKGVQKGVHSVPPL